MMAETRISLESDSAQGLRTNGSLDRTPHVQPRTVGLSRVARTDESCANNCKYHGNDDERENTAKRSFPAPFHLHALEHTDWY